MQESSPEKVPGIGTPINYEADKVSWSQIIDNANTILLKSGTVRDQGFIDAEWEDALSGRNLTLLKYPVQEGKGFNYILKITDFMLGEEDESTISFSDHGRRMVKRIMGPLADKYSLNDSGVEEAELDLVALLSGHPIIPYED